MAALTDYSLICCFYVIGKLELSAVILPSLQRLHGSFDDKLETCEDGNTCLEGSSCGNKVIEGDGKLTNIDLQREDECGICLEPCTKMVLPNCCHAMCIKCYRKW
jgi:hypothetical protein